MSYNFAAALEVGRIFVYHPDAGLEFADADCASPGWDCHFQPISSCTYEDAIEAPDFQERSEWGDMQIDGITFKVSDIPSYWKKKLIDANPNQILTPSYFKYWWRAQSGAYLMRLNANTSDLIKQLRLDPKLHQEWVRGTHESKIPPFPLPAGTMNMHVRHGDKWKGNGVLLQRFFMFWF